MSGVETPSRSVLEFGDQGRNLLPGELVEFHNSGFLAKLWRHNLHRLTATVELGDQPAGMCSIFAAPVCVRDEV